MQHPDQHLVADGQLSGSVLSSATRLLLQVGARAKKLDAPEWLVGGRAGLGRGAGSAGGAALALGGGGGGGAAAGHVDIWLNNVKFGATWVALQVQHRSNSYQEVEFVDSESDEEQ
eukprot:SAG22_NODE_353_length_11812_cov_58.910783_2_plen_116_part_00